MGDGERDQLSISRLKSGNDDLDDRDNGDIARRRDLLVCFIVLLVGGGDKILILGDEPIWGNGRSSYSLGLLNGGSGGDGAGIGYINRGSAS